MKIERLEINLSINIGVGDVGDYSNLDVFKLRMVDI